MLNYSYFMNTSRRMRAVLKHFLLAKMGERSATIFVLFFNFCGFIRTLAYVYFVMRMYILPSKEGLKTFITLNLRNFYAYRCLNIHDKHGDM